MKKIVSFVISLNNLLIEETEIEANAEDLLDAAIEQGFKDVEVSVFGEDFPVKDVAGSEFPLKIDDTEWGNSPFLHG